MTSDDDKFQLEVIDRLARIETKLDTQTPVVAKNCADIEDLKTKDAIHDAQWTLLKKLAAGAVAVAGVVIPILIYIYK